MNEITPATPTNLECRSGIITEFKPMKTDESGITTRIHKNAKHIVGNIVYLASCVPSRQIGSFLVQLIIYLAHISGVKELTLTDETGDQIRSSEPQGVYRNFKTTCGNHKLLKLSEIELEEIKNNIKDIFNKHKVGLIKNPPTDEELNIFWNVEGDIDTFFDSLKKLEPVNSLKRKHSSKGGNVKYILYPTRNRRITQGRNRKITRCKK